MSKLALLGGEKFVKKEAGDMFKWPIITKEDEDAVLEVLRDRANNNFTNRVNYFKVWTKLLVNGFGITPNPFPLIS